MANHKDVHDLSIFVCAVCIVISISEFAIVYFASCGSCELMNHDFLLLCLNGQLSLPFL